jgi:fatty acid desaturase
MTTSQPSLPTKNGNGLIDPQTLRRLSQPATFQWLAAVGLEWLLIGSVAHLCIVHRHWWAWVLGALFIGTRQHALGVLAHEGAHYLVARSHRLNNALSNYLAAYPIAFTVEGYRHTHLQHHWLLETAEDPSRVTLDLHPRDWTFPMPARRFFLILLRDLTGVSQSSSITLLKYLWDIPGGWVRHLLRMLTVQAAMLALAVMTGQWLAYLLLWVLPLFTVAVTCYRIRSVAEHSAIGPHSMRFKQREVDQLRMTRTTICGPISWFLLVPYNVSYHIEHHLFPTIPTFRLRTLQKMLATTPAFASAAHVTHGHRALLNELVTAPR